MNNIKQLRLERGLTQKEVTEFLRCYDERIDSSMLSRFENELCYPTPLIMRSLCNVLKCLPEELYGVTEQEYIEGIVKETAPAVPESFNVTELVATLDYGRRNAIKRPALAALLDVSDRCLRQTIEEARNCGYVILSLPNGGGYYLSNNTDEIHDFTFAKNPAHIPFFAACALCARYSKSRGGMYDRAGQPAQRSKIEHRSKAPPGKPPVILSPVLFAGFRLLR